MKKAIKEKDKHGHLSVNATSPSFVWNLIKIPLYDGTVVKVVDGFIT